MNANTRQLFLIIQAFVFMATSLCHSLQPHIFYKLSSAWLLLLKPAKTNFKSEYEICSGSFSFSLVILSSGCISKTSKMAFSFSASTNSETGKLPFSTKYTKCDSIVPIIKLRSSAISFIDFYGSFRMGSVTIGSVGVLQWGVLQ